MKNLKLSLKKEIISNLEAKNVKGGGFIPNPPLTICSPDGPICETVPICPTNNTCECVTPSNECPALSDGCSIITPHY